MRDVSRGPNEQQVPESMLTIIFNHQDQLNQDVAPQPNNNRFKTKQLIKKILEPHAKF